MQRFKKHLLEQYGDKDAFGYVTKGGRFQFMQLPIMSSENGKFVYGANGTLTQAARWRDLAMRLLMGAAEDPSPVHNSFEPYRHLANARLHFDSSRRGGCVLPS